MNITCDVIKDMLPLYAEGLASGDTAALVEEHLASCEACADALKELRAPVELSADTDAAPLKKVRSAMKKRKVRTIAFTALVCLVVAVTLFGWLTAPEYLQYSIQTVKLTVHEQEILSVQFGAGVTGYDISRFESETGRGLEYHITAWTSVLGRWTGTRNTQKIMLNPEGDAVAAVYYYNAYGGRENQLLYGEGDENVITLPRLFLAYYLVFALGLAVLLLAAALVWRGNRKARKALWHAALVPAAYLLAHLCVKGTYTMTFAPIRDLSLILLAAVPIYGLLFLAAGKRLKRGDTPRG